MLTKMPDGQQDNAMSWSSSRVRGENQRNEAWEQLLKESHLPWKIGKRPEDNFRAELEYRNFGGYTLSHCQCTTLDGFRSKAEIADTNDAYLSLLYLHAGEEKIMAAGKEIVISEGDIVLWDSTQEMKFSVPEKVDKISLLIPEKNITSVFPRAHDYVGAVLKRENSMNSIIGGHLSNLALRMNNMDDHELTVLMDASINLFAAAFKSGRSIETSIRHATVSRIKQHIIDHLGDPFLSPKGVAEDAGISLRYLYTLFESEGTGVSAWIRDRRLECARKELASSFAESNSITDIAFKWGFCDLSHFSKAFKQSFGLSPREFAKKMDIQNRI